MTLMACCSGLTDAPADATNEKGSPQPVAISWSAGLVEDALHLLAVLVKGLVYVLWDDLLDVGGP